LAEEINILANLTNGQGKSSSVKSGCGIGNMAIHRSREQQFEDVQISLMNISNAQVQGQNLQDNQISLKCYANHIAQKETISKTQSPLLKIHIQIQKSS
jgi:hypothetical protein